jgi:dTDP-4-amino-4,6-dideoxygalactose transaminase
MATEYKVKLVDLGKQYLALKGPIDEAVARVLERGAYVGGEEVEAFEEQWAAYCGADYCVAVSSGTDAIYLALTALRPELRQRNVARRAALPSFTFIGTLEPVVRAEYEPVLFDVEVDTGLMKRPPDDFDGIALPVSLYGQEIPWVTDREWTVVEDGAQAHGRKAQARMTTYSFYPTKNLGAAGQAGAVVLNSKRLRDEIKVLREHGEHGGRFRHTRLSGNYRMDPLQAAILTAKLPHLDSWTARRRKLAGAYDSELGPLREALEYSPPVQENSVYHVYPFTVEPGDRDKLVDYLTMHGIQSAVRYPIPLHRQPAFPVSLTAQQKLAFPNSDAWASSVINLPIHDQMEEWEVDYVVKTVKEFYGL